MSQTIDLGNTNVVSFNGQEVEILRLNGVSIWQKFTGSKDLVYNVSFTSENYKSPTLKFTKQDTQPTTISWGDGSAVETISTSGTQAVNHTYSSIGDYTITISGDGKINIDAGALGSQYNDADDMGYPKSLKGLIIGSIVDRIENSAFQNSYMQTLIAHSNITYIGDLNWSNSNDNVLQEYISENVTIYYFVAEDNETKYAVRSGYATSGNTRIPEGTILLSENLFSVSTTNVIVPSSVKYFCKKCLNSTGDLIFNQPLGMEVFLPEAGDGTGLSYSKNAVERNIYTDNETIKNYNWAGDNITATLYHLDGTLWG